MPVFSENLYKGVVVQGVQNTAADEEAMLRIQDTILENAAACAGVTFPEDQINAEADLLQRAYLSQIRYDNLSSGDYMTVLMDMQMNPEEYLQRFRRDALRDMRVQAAINGIIEAEKFQVTYAELEEEARAMAQRLSITLAEVKDFLGEDLSMLEHDLLERKVRALVYESAVFPESEAAS